MQQHTSGGSLAATATTDPVAGLERYERHHAVHITVPSQSLAWVREWIRPSDGSHCFVFLEDGSSPALALALEIRKKGPFRVARFLGGSHANGNFPLAAQGLSKDQVFPAIRSAVVASRLDVDVVSLERMMPVHCTGTNPLVGGHSARSPNIALAVDLKGGFDAVLARNKGDKKQKKHRLQLRKFQSLGGVRRFRADSAAEVEACLSAFFRMKAERFRKAGIDNVFARPDVQESLRRLFVNDLTSSRRMFVLHGLEIGGRLRAVTGSSVIEDRVICEFGGFFEGDDVARFSPGGFLFFENIREACQHGVPIYDFSVGDEPYKRSWSDIETVQYDTHIPITAKGAVLARAMTGTAAAKGWIKSHPQIWSAAKHIRRALHRERQG